MTMPPSRCEGFSPLIDMCLDGELSELEAERVKRHLDGCERCQRIASRRTKLRRKTAALVIPAPPGLAAAIVAEIERPVAPLALVQPTEEVATS